MQQKTVYLGWHDHHPITVSEEGYAALQALIAQHRVCCRCGTPYSEENPMVLENVCLLCVRAKQEDLVLVGPAGEPDEDGYQRFKFLDWRGHVFLSSTRYEDAPKQDDYQTLVHWNFPVPSVYTPPRGEAMRLHTSGWSIYGDVQASAVVIERYYDQRRTCAFLSYKGGEARELTRRDGEMRSLLEQAADILAETKDEQGYYHAGRYVSVKLTDSMLYPTVSQIASAVYNVKLSYRQSKHETAEQPVNEEMTAS